MVKLIFLWVKIFGINYLAIIDCSMAGDNKTIRTPKNICMA